MATNSSPVPPYVSLGVLNTAAKTLADTTVPNGPIDRRVLDGLSGADYGALMSALRFMSCVDDQRVATPRYRELVAAMKEGEAKYKPALLQVLQDAYQPILGGLDVQHGTAAQLEKAFRDADVSAGQMLTKTVRFYLKALKFCGADVSPHITKPKTPSTPKNGGGKRTKTKKPKPDNPPIMPVTRQEQTPSGFERLTIPGLSGAFIQYPANLTDANFDLFEAMLGVLRTYVKGRAGKEKKP